MSSRYGSEDVGYRNLVAFAYRDSTQHKARSKRTALLVSVDSLYPSDEKGMLTILCLGTRLL